MALHGGRSGSMDWQCGRRAGGAERASIHRRCRAATGCGRRRGPFRSARGRLPRDRHARPAGAGYEMLWTCHWLGRPENRAENTSRVVTAYRTCLAILSAFPSKSSLLCSTALRLGAGMVIHAQPPRAYCQAMPGPGPVQNARCPATSGGRWLICSFDPGQFKPLAEPVRWHCPRA